MRRTFILAIVLAGLSLMFLPSLKAEEAKWKVSKTRIVQLGKTGCISPVFKPGIVGGGRSNLPVKGGNGIKIKVTPQKVLVDKDGKGKANFRAAQGTASKAFPITLVYPNGDKVKHSIKIVKSRRSWVFIRDCAVSVSIGGAKMWILDDNNNGIYGEDGEDAICTAKSPWAAPLSRLVLIKGKMFEIEVSESGKSVKSRPFTGKMGSLDIFKEWTGKKNPDVVVVQGNTQSEGKIFLNVAFKKPVMIPLGSYSLVRAYMKDVVIHPGNTNFDVGGGEPATMKWGLKMRVNASHSYNVKKKTYTIQPIPTVVGVSGEQYKGDYLEGPRFSFKVGTATANGKPVGRTSTWVICGS